MPFVPRSFVFASCLFLVFGELRIYDEFKLSWCQQRKWRVDWESLKKPCDNFEAQKEDLKQQAEDLRSGLREAFGSDPEKSSIITVESKRAGEFTKVYVQSRTKDGVPKTFGGDSWRLRIDGPSTVDGTVFDMDNGLYEALFLIMEPGSYVVQATLEYTLCDGLRDPPMQWFKEAHCSGKHKNVDLNKELCANMKEYMNQPIRNASFTVSPARVSESEIQSYMRRADNECAPSCNLMWDGFGRWVGGGSFLNGLNGPSFKPYMIPRGQDYRSVKSLAKNYYHTKGQGCMWIYGDSLSFYFYEALTTPIPHDLCSKVFANCSNTYNWIYPKTLYELTETCAEVDLNVERVLKFLHDVLKNKALKDRESAFLFNAGAHYVKTTKFDAYRKVLDAIVATTKMLYKGKFIWRSTTAVHGQTADIMGAFRRYTTNQRIQLYNAYAHSVMCRNGLTILDVYPLTSSYPPGTKDGIHYERQVFFPVYDLLEQYFSGDEILLDRAV